MTQADRDLIESTLIARKVIGKGSTVAWSTVPSTMSGDRISMFHQCTTVRGNMPLEAFEANGFRVFVGRCKGCRTTVLKESTSN
jgi:hypothetical protein